MRYYRIIRTYDPLIIGINDASAQVEICRKKDKYSFEDKESELYFYDYANKFAFGKKDALQLLSLNDYQTIDDKKIKKMTLFKTKKRVKNVDIMSYQIHYNCFDFVFSEKLINIIDKYKIPIHNRIPVTIDGFQGTFFLVGFPKISEKEYDFEKTIFYDDYLNEKYQFSDIKEYQNHPKYFLLQHRHIVLKSNYDYDILAKSYLYFSEKLIDEIVQNDILALTIDKRFVLENG
ncbi:MAG: hypothetical protein Q4B43_10190 [Bacteroidota bacterium]|nr:hypothetical protein [Bacteroidota bacterium]